MAPKKLALKWCIRQVSLMWPKFPSWTALWFAYHTKWASIQCRYEYVLYPKSYNKYSENLSLFLFQSERYSFMIVLPNRRDGIQDLITGLEKFDLSAARSKLERRHVHITMPVFRFDTTSYLKESLKTVSSGLISGDIVWLSVWKSEILVRRSKHSWEKIRRSTWC